jgi:hypothetical protein
MPTLAAKGREGLRAIKRVSRLYAPNRAHFMVRMCYAFTRWKKGIMLNDLYIEALTGQAGNAKYQRILAGKIWMDYLMHVDI